MPLPFSLQKLPPEALNALRYLGKVSAATADDLGAGAGLGSRLVGKAIRRLVNAGYILLAPDDTYQLTTDGRLATQQIAEYDQETAGSGSSQPAPEPVVPQVQAQVQAPALVQRHLSVVMPRRLAAGRTSDLYVGVNPPSGERRLPGPVRIELRAGAVGGAISPGNLWLDIPPDEAAAPGKFSLTPTQPGRAIRVRVDAFQMFGFDQLEPLGGIYFDAHVSADSTPDPTTRAVGMDIVLKSAR
jgi:hypothetical protein